MANKFTLDHKDVNSILKSEKYHKKLEQAIGNTRDDIFQDFELPIDDTFVMGLRKAINDNKVNSGTGIPKGSIFFGGWEISIDDIFSSNTQLQEYYNNALAPQNSHKKEELLEWANNKLIYAILLLLSTDNVEAINHPKSIIKIKRLIIDGEEIEKSRKRINREKFVARDNVAKQLASLRHGRDFPEGTIELRPGVEKDINKMTIFNNFKNLYKNAKNEDEKVQLDTQFAEQIILKSNYYIQIDNKFINSDNINFKDEQKLISDTYNCRDSLNNTGFSTESLIIEDENGEIYYIVRKKKSVIIPPIPTDTETPTPTDTETPTPTDTETPTPTDTETPTPTDTETPTPTDTETPNPTNTETPTPTDTETPTPTDTETPTPTDTETPTPTPIPTPTPTPTPIPIPTPTPTPTPTPDPDLPTSFEENVVLSDVSESYEDMISREVENEINEEWHNTGKFNIFKRLDLFLRRGRIRKKKIKKMKESYQRTPFTNNGTVNREMAKQAARHDLEQVLQGEGVTREAFGRISRREMISDNEYGIGREFKEICQDYISGRITKIDFQNKFNQFVHDKLRLPGEQQFLATNVLEKLDAIKNDNDLLHSITSDLELYLTDHDNSHFDSIRNKIDDDFKKYRRDPRFRAQILEILGDGSSLSREQLDEKVNKFIRHQKALARMSTQNLQIKLDLLLNGKGAYQTNNKDRENWLFKIGHAFDKMPRWGQALTVAGISASGIAVGLLGGSALAATATVSGLVGAKNFIKKWTHHTKEQNTYEKNLTRNYEEEIAQMREWQRIRTEKDSNGKYTNGWFKRYKAKRQLELYGKTTQVELQREDSGNTKELVDFIYTAIERYDSLNSDEKNALNCTLLDAKARLEIYWAMGHNFLKSKDKNQIERNFYDLENALNLGAKRTLGTRATLKNISLIEAFDGAGSEVNYNDLLNLYKKDYRSATKKFRGERARLATKWGLGTAAITFGTAAATQAITHTGMFAREAVAGTPGTPSSVNTSSTSTVTDNYGMAGYELSGGNQIFTTAQNNISGLSPSDTVTLHFGAGTDGTTVQAGSRLLNHSTYIAKLDQVKDVITHSSLSNKSALIHQLDNGFATSGFTNTDLHGMRCLEAIEETVKGAGNFAGTLNLSYDPIMDIDGTILHDTASRMSSAFLEISKVIPGTPGTEPIPGGNKWLVVGLPRFSNTFKRKNSQDTTERTEAPTIEGDTASETGEASN